MTGWNQPLVSMLTMIEEWGLLCWYSAAMAMLSGGLSEYSELGEKIWHPLAYFQLPLSGGFGMVSWLPKKFRSIILIFLVPHCVELFRYGYYGGKGHAMYNVPYVIAFCVVLTWLALFVVRDVKGR